MEFQKLTWVDNNVPSLSIGGFTNGVRVVDMAKGYSTLANRGVYDERTCIVRIEHQQQGELTKHYKPFAKQVYQEDSAFMLTDILKGTLTESYGTGRGLALENGMPAAGKTGTTNSSKDTWFCGYTRYYTTAVWVGYDIPRAMPGIYGSTYAGKIWKRVMDEIHTGLEPLDWEQPASVEMQEDSSSGITDYVSTTAQLRAQQSIHDKEQRRLAQELETSVSLFEKKIIETVEDTYWVNEQYQSIITQLNQMDEGDARGTLLDRTTSKYAEFTPIIDQMQDTIALYEQQKAREAAEAQKKAEEDAVKAREDLEAQTRKNTFLTALMDVEKLEYQAPNAQQLVQTAIDRLPLVEDYEEAASYSQRLEAAIARISTLPTAAEWKMMEEKKAEEEARKQAQEQQQIQNRQAQLQGYLAQERMKWSISSPVVTGPGVPSGALSSGTGNEKQNPAAQAEGGTAE